MTVTGKGNRIRTVPVGTRTTTALARYLRARSQLGHSDASALAVLQGLREAGRALRYVVEIHFPLQLEGIARKPGLGETFDTGKLKASLNPLAKVAMEASAGKRFFSDMPFTRGEQEAPKAWVPVVAALYALGPLTRHLGLPSIKRDGTSFTLSDADVNKIESLVPVLGRLKRLAPSDERSQAKAFSSWLSFAFGISTQTLIDNADAVSTASGTLSSKAKARAAETAAPRRAVAPQPKPLSGPSGSGPSGIRPSGSGAPRNAVIAGSYNAVPYQGGR